MVHNIKGDAVCQGKGKEDHQAIGRFDVRKGKKMGKTQITEQEINAVIDLYRKLTPERKVTYLAHLRKLDADTPAPAQAVQETSCEE